MPGLVRVALHARLRAGVVRAGDLGRREHRAVDGKTGGEEKTPNGDTAEKQGVFWKSLREGHGRNPAGAGKESLSRPFYIRSRGRVCAWLGKWCARFGAFSIADFFRTAEASGAFVWKNADEKPLIFSN
ncbi:MAG: hypothetical protein WDM96_07785 [Lacunisphaera sp.]